MKIHIVKKGDTLYELSQKYYVELDKLIVSNPQIVNPDQIEVGMKVKIPTAPKPMEPAEGTYKFKHVVKQGDSLWKLSKAWDVPLADLIGANSQLKNPNVLLTGEIVYIPKSAGDAAGTQTVPVGQQGPVPPQTMPVGQPMPTPLWAAEAPGPQMGVPGEWPGMHAGWPFEAPGLHAGYPPGPQESPGTPGMTETSAMQSGSPGDAWTYEPFMPSIPQSPLLTEPYPGMQGWGEQTAHPFAQAHVPATEAFAQQQPELPQIPGQPFGDYMHQYGSYPYFAGPGAAASAYDMTPSPYPYYDCCFGPHLEMPGGFGGYAAHGPGSLPYAAPLTSPYAAAPAYPTPPMQDVFGYGPGMPVGVDPSVAYTSSWPGHPGPIPSIHGAPEYGHMPPVHSYGDIPSYPEEAGAVKLEEKEEQVDITLDEDNGSMRTKSASSGKRAKLPSQQEQLVGYLRTARQRGQEKQEPRPNMPWINV